jgi:hypothetical protein
MVENTCKIKLKSYIFVSGKEICCCAGNDVRDLYKMENNLMPRRPGPIIELKIQYMRQSGSAIFKLCSVTDRVRFPVEARPGGGILKNYFHYFDEMHSFHAPFF